MSKARYSAAFIALALAGLLSALDVREDTRLKAYKDGADIWSNCKGNTHNVDPKRVMTEAECKAIDTPAARRDLLFVLDKVDMQLTIPQAIELSSFSYNVGRTAFVNSTVRRKLNAGDLQGGCDAILDWHYITVKGKKFDCLTPGNKRCAGLPIRRKDERAGCLKAGVPDA